MAAFGCDGGDGDSDGGPASTGALRIWHLAPDAGAVDIFIDGELSSITGLDFEQNTDFIDLPAGSYDLAVAPAGGALGDAVITVDNFSLAADSSWTIVAWQTNQEGTAFDALAIEEDLSAPADGSIKLRPFHVSFLVTSAVDIHNVDGDTNPEVLPNLAQGAVSDNALELPNAAYTLGIDTDQDGTIDLQTAAPIDMPVAGSFLTVGVLTKPEGDEFETEVVFLVNRGANIHDEVELEPFGE